jgi:hypothetical protein
LTSKYSDQLEREVKNIKQECEDKMATANQVSSYVIRSYYSYLGFRLDLVHQSLCHALPPD